MTSKVKPPVLLPLCAAVAAVLGTVAGPVPAQADQGCPGSLVPRSARPGDNVCVTPAVAAQVQQENATAADRREPGGGAYGPLTCKQGWVWREAFDGDGVCVTPERRQETWDENANAPRATATAPPPGQPGNPPPAQPSADQGAAVLSLINQQRAANGCGALNADPQLTNAARRHGADMMNNGVTGHTGSDGSTPESRITDAGYAFSKDGEIVYYWDGSPNNTPAGAVEWWMNSPGHRAIIVDCSFTDVGFAAPTANGKIWAVGVFGKH